MGDESEKEVDVAKKDKSEGSIEALKENEEVEVHIEQKLVHPPEMKPDDDHPEAQEENKEKDDEDEKDICDNKEEKVVDKLDNEGMNQSCDKVAEENKEEPTVEPEKEKEQEDTKEDSKEEKAADSFVNDISEAEGRQEPTEPKKEEKQEESTSEPEDEEKEKVMPGVLTVHVIEASNLLNKDIMGKSDPYVEISFEETKVKSSTVTNSLSPLWNFISNFDVTGDDTSRIIFSVFDADYGKDQLLGSCSLSIKDALSELDSAKWISLEE